MSYIYGKTTKRPTGFVAIADTKGSGSSKLIETLAGILPADLLAAHGIIIAATTKTTENTDGSSPVVEILNEAVLKNSGVALIIASFVLFGIGLGKGPKSWTAKEWGKAFVPPFAFIAWMFLTGVSAITPWFEDFSSAARTACGAVLGLVMVAVASKLAEKQAPVA